MVHNLMKSTFISLQFPLVPCAITYDHGFLWAVKTSEDFSATDIKRKWVDVFWGFFSVYVRFLLFVPIHLG